MKDKASLFLNNLRLDKKGFTLIEVIVSVAILAIITIIIMHVFLASSNVTTGAEQFAGKTLSNSSALDRVLGSNNIELNNTNPETDVDFGTGDNRNNVNVEISEEGVTKEFTFKDNGGTVVSKVGVKGDVYSSKEDNDDKQELKAFNAYDDGFTTTVTP